MAATVRPRGPLPPRVYWTRRLLVLGLPLLLVVVLARVLNGSGDGGDTDKATQAGARTTATVPDAGPLTGPTAPPKGTTGKKGRKGKKAKPPEPVLAEPSGPCDPADIVVTPVITEAAGGSDVPIPLNLRTLVTEACTWQVSAETLTVTITSGNDHIWSSRECPAAIPLQDVVVRQAVDTPVVITWDDARRSDETCSTYADWAKLGWYHVQAAALGGDEADVQFELVAPSPAVVTKTVEPETPGKKGKKQRQQDTTHEPGEDGGGNSAG
jgi:hypothetical protein